MSTITFRRLERLGRAGNQVWQLASTMCIAERLGLKAVFPRWSLARYFSIPEHYWVDDVPEYAVNVESLPAVQHIPEQHRPYLQNVHLLTNPAMIREFFAPSALGLSILNAKWPGFLGEDGVAPRVTSLHVRRGDALAVPKLYPLQSTGYYQDALASLPPAPKFPSLTRLFSDDLSWTRSNFPFEGMPGNADWEDLLLMAACGGGHVISNSSFAWWGAWLSGDEHVRFPYVWYGPQFRDIDVHQTMVPPTWVPIRDQNRVARW